MVDDCESPENQVICRCFNKLRQQLNLKNSKETEATLAGLKDKPTRGFFETFNRVQSGVYELRIRDEE